MTLEPADLLAGVRGRRLCLELAVATSWVRDPTDVDRMREGIITAANDLDPDPGTTAVLFGQGSEAAALPAHSPETVAQLLDAVPPAEPEERMVWLALAAAVDHARYWQAPDGEDVLAGAQELRASLARIAAQVVKSPHAAWWSAPMDDVQWIITFAEESVAASGADARLALDQWHENRLAEEAAAARERPLDPYAPWSGAWWSMPPSRLAKSTCAFSDHGPVGLSLVEDSFGWTDATVEQLIIPQRARVYEIDGPEAWAELCRRHPLDVTASRRHDWFRTTGRDGRWVIPNWALLRNEYDAVHLTVGGYLSTAGLPVPVSGGVASVLAGWNPDQTYWLRDVRLREESVQSWTFGQDGRAWELSTIR